MERSNQKIFITDTKPEKPGPNIFGNDQYNRYYTPSIFKDFIFFSNLLIALFLKSRIVFTFSLDPQWYFVTMVKTKSYSILGIGGAVVVIALCDIKINFVPVSGFPTVKKHTHAHTFSRKIMIDIINSLE